jgi:peptidoglycan/LPS O-acetylase OafA/YrhL
VRLISCGLLCGIILADAISLERIGIRVPRIFVALGASSYSLYVVHRFILATFGKARSLMHLSAKAPAVLLGLMAFCAALIVAHAVRLWFEKPMTAWLSNGSADRRKARIGVQL